MGMYGNTRFKEATRGETPQFSLAAARQAQGDQREMSQQIALAKSLKTGYNDMMGENTPIADQVSSWFGKTPDGSEAADYSGDAMSNWSAAQPTVAGEGGSAADYTGEAMSNWSAAQGAETANALRSVETGMQTAEQIAAAQQAAAAEEAAALAAQQAAAEGGAAAASSSTPWGLILAAAMANEGNALAEEGRRDTDEASYRTDLLSGAVLEQDAEIAGDKVGGMGGKMIEVGGALGNPEGAYKTLLKNPTEKIIDDPFNPFAMFS